MTRVFLLALAFSLSACGSDEPELTIEGVDPVQTDGDLAPDQNLEPSSTLEPAATLEPESTLEPDADSVIVE